MHRPPRYKQEVFEQLLAEIYKMQAQEKQNARLSLESLIAWIVHKVKTVLGLPKIADELMEKLIEIARIHLEM